MDKQDLENSGSLLEQVVSLDWASPTGGECKAFGIDECHLHSRICFRPDNVVWIIEGNEFRSLSYTEDQTQFWTLSYRYGQDNNNPVPR